MLQVLGVGCCEAVCKISALQRMAPVTTLPEVATNRLDLELGFWQLRATEFAPFPETKLLELTEILTVRSLLPFKAPEQKAM